MAADGRVRRVGSVAHPTISTMISQSSTVPQIHLIGEAVLSLLGYLFRTGGLAVAVYISMHADQAHYGRDHVHWVGLARAGGIQKACPDLGLARLGAGKEF